MKTKEAINILNHAVEYYDMLYSSGDSRHDEEEKNKVWKALNQKTWLFNGIFMYKVIM